MKKQITITKDDFKKQTMPILERMLESIVTAETIYSRLEEKLFEGVRSENKKR